METVPTPERLTRNNTLRSLVNLRYVDERERQANIVDVETLFLARNGTSLHPSSIRKMVKKYYAKAGVRKSGVHTLRHTFSAHNVKRHVDSRLAEGLGAQEERDHPQVHPRCQYQSSGDHAQNPSLISRFSLIYSPTWKK